MAVKLTKREAVLLFVVLAFIGLFLGMVAAQNNTVDRLQACATKLQQKHALRCGPKLVNAPGQDINFSMFGDPKK